MKNAITKNATSIVMGGVLAGTLAWADAPTIDLTGFRVAVLATDGYEQAELSDPVKTLRDAHASVDIISLNGGTIQGMKHMDKGDTVRVDKVLSQVSAKDYDGVMLPGGAMNADTLRTITEAKTFIEAMDQAHKPIAAICHAPWLLVSAGIVHGRTLTSYHSIQDDITNAGGTWQDKDMVRDRNWVTSRQPSDLKVFDRAMLELFSESKLSANTTPMEG